MHEYEPLDASCGAMPNLRYGNNVRDGVMYAMAEKKIGYIVSSSDVGRQFVIIF
jgi:hypothetical protein